MMKVVFLVPRLDKSSTRYRVLQYLPYLEGRKISVDVEQISRNSGSRRTLFRKLIDYDIVFLQKRLLQRWELWYLRKKAKKLIYDFDDAVMYKNRDGVGQKNMMRWRKFRNVVEKSDLVIAGNGFLADIAREYQSRVRIIPTVVDTTRYRLKDYAVQRERLTLGWIGNSGNLPYLRNLASVFETLSKRHPLLELKVVSGEDVQMREISVINKHWRLSEEIEDICSFDVGLMPLSDNLWTRGKCGLKIIQYFAAGLPVVASPVGVNREIVTDGINGFWAGRAGEWLNKLSSLIESKDLRRQFGLNGRKVVEEEYSLAKSAPLLVETLEETIG